MALFKNFILKRKQKVGEFLLDAKKKKTGGYF